MRFLIVLGSVALLAGCAASSRWQVASSTNGDILLNTETGETWSRYRAPTNGQYANSYWVKMGPRVAATQP